MGVQGIPTLVLLNGATGKVITTDGRGCVMADPKGSGMPFPASSQEQVAGIKNALDGKRHKCRSILVKIYIVNIFVPHRASLSRYCIAVVSRLVSGVRVACVWCRLEREARTMIVRSGRKK